MIPIDLSAYGDRFASRKPRILVGLVAFGDIDPEVVLSWIGWTGFTAKHFGEQVEVTFVGGLRKEQYRARNFICEAAVEMDADFVLMADDDQMVADCPEMLRHYLELAKPVQCGVAFKRGEEGDRNPTVYRDGAGPEPEIVQYTRAELPSGPCPVDYSGGGMTWLDISIVKGLRGNWWWPHPMTPVVFRPDPQWGLDLNMCRRVRNELGEQIWLNTNVVTGHMQAVRKVIR